MNLSHAIPLRRLLALLALLLAGSLSPSHAQGPGPAATAVRLPAEYEPVQAVLLTWPMALRERWPTYAELVGAIASHAQAIVIVPDRQAERQVLGYLRERGEPGAASLTFWHIATDSMWIRDYGPLYRLTGASQPRLDIADLRYRPLERPPLLLDDALPARVARIQSTASHRVELVLEGGNLLSDGHGRCFTTTTILTRNADLGRQAIEALLRQELGCDDLVILPTLRGEPTGHVGLMVKVLRADTLLVAACAGPGDDYCGALDQVARALGRLRSAEGNPYRIIRIPYPWVGMMGTHRAYASYVNAVLLNGTALVPSFGLPQDEQALQVYREALPDYTVVPVDAASLAEAGGALQCITVSVPQVGPPARAAPPGARYDAYIPAAAAARQQYQFSCEFDAGRVIMKSYGLDVTVDELIARLPRDEQVRPRYEDTSRGVVIYGGDILAAYSGDYAHDFLARTTGRAFARVFASYGLETRPVGTRRQIEAALRRGNLVWLKTTVDFRPGRPAVWVTPAGARVRTVLGNDHAVVAIGFNAEVVVVRDVLGPTATNRRRPTEYEVPWERFLAAWAQQDFDGLEVLRPRRSSIIPQPAGASVPNS